MEKELKDTTVFHSAERLEIVNRLEQKEHELLTTKKNLDNVKRELEELVPRTCPETEPEFDFTPITYTGVAAAVIVAVLFVLHCVVWVLNLIFSISWDTWGWTKMAFWGGIGITVIVTIATIAYYFWRKKEYSDDLEAYNLYKRTQNKLTSQSKEITEKIKKLGKEAEDIKSEYSASLASDIRDFLAVPIDNNAIAYEDRHEAEQLMQEHYSLVEKYRTTEDITEKLQLRSEVTNSKLRLFYLLSIKGEAYYTYPVFEEQLHKAENTGNYGLMRVEVKDEVANMHFNKLQQYTALLNDNKMAPILRELNNVKDIDTKGFFGMQSVDALAEKTELLQDLLREASAEYNELSRINNNIGYLLEYLRVCAYRNIYLGAELLNYLRDNAGGKSLTTEKGTVDMKIELENIDISFDSLRMDIVGNLTSSVSNCIEVGTKMLDDKEMVNFMKSNPKAALGLAAGAAAFSLVEGLVTERNEKIKQNTKIQKDVIKNIKLMVDNYTKGQGSLLRAIEIIKAIKKANDGYMNVYEPLRHKVFDEGQLTSVTMKELQQMAMATKEYNKISQAKL